MTRIAKGDEPRPDRPKSSQPRGPGGGLPDASRLDGLDARAILALQRSSGNAVVAAAIARGATPSRRTPGARAPEPVPPSLTFPSRAAMVRAMKAEPDARDLARGCRFLDSTSMGEILAIGRELLESTAAALVSLEGAAGSTSRIVRERVRVALAAIRMRGHLSRLDFEREHRSDLAVLRRRAPREVEQVLRKLGPRVPESR